MLILLLIRNRDFCSVSFSFNFLLQSPKPICMFYFSHPFGIASPSSTASTNAGKTTRTAAASQQAKKQSKYTTTTYLVTEIQRNDPEEYVKKPNTSKVEKDSTRIPWPKNTWSRSDNVLPPLLQIVNKKGL